MRLFVSVDIHDLASEVDRIQAPLRELPGINPTDPEQAHITMKFLGESDHDLDDLTGAIEAAVEGADTGAFEATFEGLGVFPSLDYISVIWLGVSEGTEPLTTLHENLEFETTALGYDEERHEFTPHVTLGRMDHAAAKEDVQRLVREEDPEAGTLHVDELRLKKSTLTEEGPEYETVERFPL
ncbi:RNA 2',3'-cyclic phosphodiesterase [Natronomonas halophila]|uniref:RNA 2',3'-cyclic phosphodiesterase n=1 Tax=Natronomonas halophila TaxID=2747817 RepID=UPI0015B4EBBB|nr:RNA 2',3'-cyclic phosphodiesterase [Natronomonas halophila]QLD86366.1 RNA 2',3'-cyclic phosphodiesterase [Natronomonas halophila]